MKKISHSKFSLSSLKHSAAFVLLFLLCVVIFIWRSFFTGVFWYVGAPLLQAKNVLFAPFTFLSAAFSSRSALETQNLILQNKLASTTALLADRNALYQDNIELKKRFERDIKLQTTLAGVLLAPPHTPYDTLLIDAGSAQGLTIGDLVSAGGTTLVGKIIEVHPSTAIVSLYSAPENRYDMLLLVGGSASTTRESVPIELAGQGGGSLYAQVPAGTPVKKGDVVVTPGVAEGFVGTVSSVTKKESESFETLYVTLPVNPLELRFVEVWRKEE